MGAVAVVGGIFGAMIGAILFRLLQAIGQIDIAISILYVVMLGFIGSLMMQEAFLPQERRKIRLWFASADITL